MTLKFFNFIDIMPEVYSASRSHETRLILGPEGTKVEISSDVFYHYTQVIINIRESNVLSLRDYLVSHSLLICDYLNKSLIANNNVLALFTLGLNVGKESDIIRVLTDNRCIANFIGKNYARHFSPDKYDEMTGTLLNFGYTDMVFNMNRLLYILRKAGMQYWGFTSRDFIVTTMYNFGGVLRRDAVGVPTTNVNSKQSAAWFVIVHDSFSKLDVSTQNWQNSQTSLVKMFTPKIRMLMSLDDHSLHIWRVYAIKNIYPEAVVFNDIRVNALMDGKYYAVAGHPLNMLIASNLVNIDFYRYTRTLLNNVRAYSLNDFSYEVDMLNYGLNSERPMVGLWHNRIEYQLALNTYRLMVRFGLFERRIWEEKIYEEFIIEASEFKGFNDQSETAKIRLLDEKYALEEMPMSQLWWLEDQINDQVRSYKNYVAEKNLYS